jgi:hypothetical protein
LVKKTLGKSFIPVVHKRHLIRIQSNYSIKLIELLIYSKKSTQIRQPSLYSTNQVLTLAKETEL